MLSVQLGAALATPLFDEVAPGGAVLLRVGFAALVLLCVWRPDRIPLGIAVGLVIAANAGALSTAPGMAAAEA